MNTTSRIEETGEGGRIHVSQETAALIKEAGKGLWLQKRADTVTAKGKGDLETYWLICSSRDGGSVVDGDIGTPEIGIVSDLNNSGRYQEFDARASRLVDWIVISMSKLLCNIVARRNARVSPDPEENGKPKHMRGLKDGKTYLDEVKEIIHLPDFDPKAYRKEQDPATIELPEEVIEQLREYVTCIAKMYRRNPYHNFEHASHVIMSVIKLLSRIVAPQDLLEDDNQKEGNLLAALHDHTYGITSDPLTQFACAFSALIHDVDHTGVGNPQLIDENPQLGDRYRNRSVAEQNSLEISWDLLMESRFEDLRAVIYKSKSELRRFRQLVVNSVMATDIMDKDLKELRNARWDKAFKKGDSADFVDKSKTDEVNRKATIVIEHIIQASDISHTMQHWHVYRKVSTS